MWSVGLLAAAPNWADKLTAWGTTALAVLTLIIIVLTLVGFGQASRIARVRATLDLIEKSEVEERYSGWRTNFAKYADKFETLKLWTDRTLFEDKKKFRDYLNHYELVALSIKNGALSERYYKDWIGSTFVVDWILAAPYVQFARTRVAGTYNSRIFANFENKAVEWANAHSAFPLTRMTSETTQETLLNNAKLVLVDPKKAIFKR